MSKELVLKWSIPETIDEKLEEEIVSLTKEEVVLTLFKKREISLGYGAELLGLSEVNFIKFLAKKKIPFTVYDQEDWKQDTKAVNAMKRFKWGA